MGGDRVVKCAILVPSRGRPERAAAMAASVHATADGAVQVVVIVDPDEPRLMEYSAAFPSSRGATRLVTLGERLGFVGSLNRLAVDLWDEYSILGAFGDDVLFRTPGWDGIVEETLDTPGIAYGDDLIHGERHPSAVFMSSGIAKALGWLAMPGTTHQWADDAWKQLGQALDCLRFMPDVIVEHMHPAVEKAEWDATYREVFDGERAARDHAGYQEWLAKYLPGDVTAVRAALRDAA